MEQLHSTEKATAPLLVNSEQRTELLLDYAACYPRRGEPDTWGATPSDISESLISQMALIHKFARRYMVPGLLKDINPSVENYMERKFLDRFIDRCVANDENYRRALSPHPFAEEDDNRPHRLKTIEWNAKTGQASPAELLALQGIRQLGAIELASLTHPYGANIEYLDDMRSTVESSIRLFGGEVFKNPDTRYSISDVINSDAFETLDPVDYIPLSKIEKIQYRDTVGDVVGLLMTRKRTLGQLPDGTVIRERTSFVLTNESGLLTDETLCGLLETPECDHWGREAIHNNEAFVFSIENMLMKNEYSKVLPVSSTIYSFNKERVDEIDRNHAALTNKHAAIGEGHVVHDKLRYLAASQLREAGLIGMDTRKAQPAYVNMGEMAFFGTINNAPLDEDQPAI